MNADCHKFPPISHITTGANLTQLPLQMAQPGTVHRWTYWVSILDNRNRRKRDSLSVPVVVRRNIGSPDGSRLIQPLA